MINLPPHIHHAIVAEHVIVLDVRHDRYRRLGRMASNALIAAYDGGAISAGIRRELIEQGVVCPRSTGRPLVPCSVVKAGRVLPQTVPSEPSLRVAAVALAVTHAAITLKVKGLHRSLEKLSPSGPLTAVAQEDMAQLAYAYERVRPLLPMRRRCLPDALALHHLLSHRGYGPTLVIGVTDRPFRAHCWLQADDVLLTGTLDEIAPFHPIFAT